MIVFGRVSWWPRVGAFGVCLAILFLSGCGGLMKPGTGTGGGSETSGTVSGQIRNAATSEPVTASVEVSIAGTGITTTTTTGIYQLPNVPTGQQTITATAQGYQPYSRSINVVAGTQVVNIDLEPDTVPLSGQVSAPSIGVVFAPSGFWNIVTQFFVAPAHAAALAGETYVANATVQAYNWRTGELIASTITDSAGKYTLDVPEGADLLIKVSTPDGRRLSTVVAGVTGNAQADVNTVTTLAAEAMGEFFGTATPLDEYIYETLVNRVEMIVAEVGIANIDLTPGRGWIGEDFGSLEGAEESPVKVLRDEIVGDPGPVVAAKRIVSDLRSIGPAIVTSAGPLVAEAERKLEELAPAFQAIGNAVTVASQLLSGNNISGEELFEALIENGVYVKEFGSEVPEFEGFRVAMTPAVEIPEEFPEDAIVVIPLNVEITHVNDPVLKYAGEFDIEVDDEGRIAEFTWSGSAVDQEVRRTMGADAVVEVELDFVPEWLDGALVGLTADGWVESPVLTMLGTFEVELARFTVGPPFMEEPEDMLLPTWIGFDGELSVPGLISGLSGFELDITQGVNGPVPFAILARDLYGIGEGSLSIGGVISVRFPNLAELDLANREETADEWLEVKWSYEGTVEIPGRHPVKLKLSAERTGASEVAFDEITYRRGGLVLSGTGTYTQSAGQDAYTYDINLGDEKGNTLEITATFGAVISVEGVIKDSNGEIGAEIVGDRNGLLVIYHTPGGQDIETIF